MKTCIIRLFRWITLGTGLLACSQLLVAQSPGTFFKQIDFDQNSDFAASIIPADSGYILLGGGTMYNNPIITATKIAKIDYAGELIWQKTYGKPYYIQRGGSWGALVKTFDGDYVSGGGSEDTSGIRNPFLIKFDENGDTLWTRTYFQPRYTSLEDLVQTPDSGYAFAGYKTMPNGKYDYYLLKTDRDGHIEWDRTYGASKQDGAVGIDLTPEGGFILSGGTDNYGNGITDGWNVKVEPTSGQIQWTKTYGTIRDDCGTFTRHIGGYFYIMTHCLDTLIHPGDFDKWAFYLAKLYPNGEIIWRTFFNDPEVIMIYNVYQLPGGGYLLMGYKNEILHSKSRAWFAKVNEDGEKCWERDYRFVADRSHIVTDMAFAPDGGFMFTGITSGVPGMGGSDFMVLKLDSMGCFTPGCDTLTSREAPLLAPEGSLRLWPNPAQEHLQVAYCPASPLRQPLLQLRNSAGQLVQQQALPPGGACLETALSLAHLPAGLYHVALYEAGRLLAGGRVIRLGE